MSNHNRRHFEPNPDGGWDVTAPGGKRASAHTDTQKQAQDRARDIVRNAGGGEVVTHGRDGETRDYDNIGRATTPTRPATRSSRR